MGRLLGLVLPLALGAAVSPTLLAVQLVMLSRRTAPLVLIALGMRTLLRDPQPAKRVSDDGRRPDHSGPPARFVALSDALNRTPPTTRRW